jgi:hypothetical protein
VARGSGNSRSGKMGRDGESDLGKAPAVLICSSRAGGARRAAMIDEMSDGAQDDDVQRRTMFTERRGGRQLCLMTCGEVAVARRLALPLPIVVLDDGWLSLIKVKQVRRRFGLYGTDLGEHAHVEPPGHLSVSASRAGDNDVGLGRMVSTLA